MSPTAASDTRDVSHGALRPPLAPFGERTDVKSASPVLTDLFEHGGPHLPLVVVHGTSLARRATGNRERTTRLKYGAALHSVLDINRSASAGGALWRGHAAAATVSS